MTSIFDPVKEYLLSEETKRGLLGLLIVVILDAVISVVGTTLTHQPALLILSNLSFLEGGLVFFVGSLIAVVRSNPRRKEKKNKDKEKDVDKLSKETAEGGLPKVSDERVRKYLTEETEPVHMPIGPLLILLGAILLALSVVALQILLLV